MTGFLKIYIYIVSNVTKEEILAQIKMIKKTRIAENTIKEKNIDDLIIRK